MKTSSLLREAIRETMDELMHHWQSIVRTDAASAVKRDQGFFVENRKYHSRAEEQRLQNEWLLKQRARDANDYDNWVENHRRSNVAASENGQMSQGIPLPLQTAQQQFSPPPQPLHPSPNANGAHGAGHTSGLETMQPSQGRSE